MYYKCSRVCYYFFSITLSTFNIIRFIVMLLYHHWQITMVKAMFFVQVSTIRTKTVLQTDENSVPKFRVKSYLNLRKRPGE
jgi:hypothetical protein